MHRLGQRAAAVFLALCLLALLAGWMDWGNGPQSYIFAILLSMPWILLVDEIVTSSIFINVLMTIAAMCLNAFIIYLVFSWIGKRLAARREND